MSDTPTTPLPPAAPAAPAVAPKPAMTISAAASWAVAGLTAFFSPVISLVKARSWWVYVLFAVLAFFMVSIRAELKATLLASVITLGTSFFGYIIAKIVSPEISITKLIGVITDKPQLQLTQPTPLDPPQPPDWPDKTACAMVLCMAILQRVIYGVLCFWGAIYMIPSIADKVR